MAILRKMGLGLAAAAAAWFACTPVLAQAAAQPKPRLIVITDIGTEPDDIESMVRVLTYANEIDIEGLIAGTSRHLPNKVWPSLIEERVAAYGQVLANLRVHDPRYPDAALLKSRIRAWRPELGMLGVGAGKDNAASQLIIAAVDKADARPVWVSVWGGAAPLAQALWHVKTTRSPAAVARFIAKLRVYSISDQDDSGPWARATFPQLFWIASVHGPSNYDLAAWSGISSSLPGADPAPVARNWLRINIQRKGPLGALYPLPIFIMEGDTPSFLNLIDNGLSVPEHPDWGGWGGRWEQPSPAFGHYADTVDSVKGADGKDYRGNKESVWRWRSAFQNDFAMRMAWSVTPKYADANHPPQLVINGQPGSAPVTIMACPGEVVNLSTKGSIDPDGQPLTWRWFKYAEATRQLVIAPELATPDAESTTVVVKPWVHNYMLEYLPVFSFHIIAEATDSGKVPLTRYRRVILEIPSDGRMVNGKACPKIARMAEPEGTGFLTRASTSTTAWSTEDSDIGSLIDDPRTRPILERHLPMIIAAAKGTPQTRGMTLHAIKHFVPGLSDEKLKAMDEELAKIPE